MEEFTLYRKRIVASTKPVQPGKKIQLSSLDLLMENHYITVVYYYKIPTILPLGSLTTRLRTTLSEITSYFPIITGRLIKNDEGKWMIKCNDAGVRIIEARAKGSVENWLENIDEEKEKKLTHWEDWHHTPYYWATYYIMVTEFEQGGVALGLSCSHLITDATSVTLLIKAWADKVLYGNISIPPFFHSLPKNTLGFQKAHNQRPNNHLINHYKSLLENTSSTSAQKSKTIALSLTDQMVRSCIDSIHLSGPTTSGPSPFVALTAILWVWISRVKGKTNGLVDMSIGLDAREMIGLDQGFFGNCMVYTKVNGNENKEDDLQLATKVIGDEIERVNKERVLDLIEWLEQSKNLSPPPSFDKGNLVFLNLENVDPYSAVFVEGYEPIKIAYYNESPIMENGKVLMFPSHPSEGELSRIVMVTLPHNEAVKLCEDTFFSRFSPSILMGERKSTS